MDAAGSQSYVADLYDADLAPDDRDDDDAADPAPRDDVVSPKSAVPLPLRVRSTVAAAAPEPAPPAGIQASFPLPDFDARTPFFGKGEFSCDAQQDVYHCSREQLLPRRKTKYNENEVVNRAKAATCHTCSVKAACTTSDHGRIVHRSFYEAYLEKVLGYHASEIYQKAMRKRKVWVELLFAEAKEWHGLRRLRLRGLTNANIQGLLIATGQNLKRFLAARDWGRRHAPCGSLVSLPGQPSRLDVVSG